jgi:hypothetical protein
MSVIVDDTPAVAPSSVLPAAARYFVVECLDAAASVDLGRLHVGAGDALRRAVDDEAAREKERAPIVVVARAGGPAPSALQGYALVAGAVQRRGELGAAARDVPAAWGDFLVRVAWVRVRDVAVASLSAAHAGAARDAAVGAELLGDVGPALCRAVEAAAREHARRCLAERQPLPPMAEEGPPPPPPAVPPPPLPGSTRPPLPSLSPQRASPPSLSPQRASPPSPDFTSRNAEDRRRERSPDWDDI